ncbi:MAG: hypothetical protein ACRD1Z_01325, partial [Vicinamibacteria bacterium]
MAEVVEDELEDVVDDVVVGTGGAEVVVVVAMVVGGVVGPGPVGDSSQLQRSSSESSTPDPFLMLFSCDAVHSRPRLESMLDSTLESKPMKRKTPK